MILEFRHLFGRKAEADPHCVSIDILLDLLGSHPVQGIVSRPARIAVRQELQIQYETLPG